MYMAEAFETTSILDKSKWKDS